MSWIKVITSSVLFQITFHLLRPRIASFADIIKIGTMVIETTFESSKQVKEIEIIYVLKCNL